jgi:thioredoxin-related protein
MVFFSLALNATEIKWASDFKSGIKQASKLNKPVFFVSSRHTCRYCVILEKTAFEDKAVIKKLNEEYIAIISYSDEQDYMPKKLWQPGTPALWFLKSNGEPMFQPLMGAMPAKKLLQALDISKKEFDKLQAKKK